MPTLDTLIILVAVYFGGAAVCSFINELIAGAFQLRGAALYRGLVNLVFGWRDLVDNLYTHPLIYSKDETPTYGAGYRFWSYLGAENNWPSYIDARNFSVGFWQTLQNTMSGGAGAALVNAVATTPAQLLGDLKTRVNAIDPSTPGIGPLKHPLTSMLTEAGDDYEKLLTLTDSWFNKQMDRIGGWYRRSAQWILLLFGFLVAFLLNVDTMQIIKYFNAEPTIASSVSTEIAAAYPASSLARKQSSSAASSANSSASASPTPTAATSTTPGSPPQPSADQIEKTADAIDQAFSDNSVPLRAIMNPGWHSGWQLFGDLITAIAFAMGAPFWFDLLGKLANVRMAGQKPKKRTTTSS